jgi:hypothetical protein
MGPVDDEEVLSQVRQMRERGSSPKQIARALGLRPSAVAPLIRRVASVQQSHADPADRVVLGCWISPGWSAGLGLEQVPQWAVADPVEEGESGSEGLTAVLIARQERASRVTVCGFLVDVYCLGVKNVTGPLSMGSSAVAGYSRQFFSGFDRPPLTVPVDLAQHLVYGAVAYARGLGFEPHPDFTAAAPYLGAPPAHTPIRFGRDGSPFYVSGPYDDPQAVIRTLEATAGAGNYHYIAHL